MSYLEAVAITVVLSELSALLYHGSLAARRHFALRAGLAEQVTTRQVELLRLQGIAAIVVILVAATRAVRGLPADALAPLGWALFSMVLSAGVYGRFPDAAPLAVTLPDWTSGRGAAFWVGYRYFLAVLASVFAVFLAVVLMAA